METDRPRLCDKCGQSFSDDVTFACHSCAKELPGRSREGLLQSLKCSLCTEVFTKAAALKQHFKTAHMGTHRPTGPFSCTEPGCGSSSADQEEHKAHMMSAHGWALIPCSFPSCRVSVLTQGDMDRHRQLHMPFGCSHCLFITHTTKKLKEHLQDHRTPLTATHVCTDGSNHPLISERQRRKRKCSPALTSSLPDEGNEEEPSRRQHAKRAKCDKSSVKDAETLPNKDFLSEGAERVYRTHACPKCRRCFKMRSHLQEHLHLHFPDPSLQCSTCQRFFTSKSKLRVHKLREAGEKVHRCRFCDYSAVEQNAIRRHLASMHADQAEEGVACHSYPCPTCGQSFRQSRTLKAHMKTHHVLPDRTPVACFKDGCSFRSALRKVLLRHAAEEHGVEAVECRHHACGAIFQSQEDMEAHRRTHQAYHCSQCEFSCSNKTVFLQHQRHGHPGNEELCCDFCPFVTFNPVEFEQHVGRLHANEKIHGCSQCSYVTPHKRGLNRHMMMHSGEKPHKCVLCEFRCRDVSYLSKHMLTHSEDKNFMCSECGYVTKWKHYLNVHMRKHAGDLRYQCDQCQYRCHRMDQLKSHKLRHQTKSLICEICAYACKRKYELRNHMLAKHSEEGKTPSVHRCKYCAYTTCYRQALQNHENCKHTKLREFHCALCSYSSFSSISLFLHKRKAHGYVPGDKAWLDNYAAKEKEKNSAELVLDFYRKSERCLKRASPTPAAESQRSRSDFPGAAASHTLDSGNIYDLVSQEVSVSDSAPSVNGSEEYCTLVLTTLSAGDYQAQALTNQEEHSADLSPTLHCKEAGVTGEHVAFSSTLSSEEEDVATTEGEQSDYEPLNNTSQPAQPQRSESGGGAAAVSPSSPSDPNQPRKPKISLKDMKKLERDQAEAMVMEGRVDVLVVPSEDRHRREASSCEVGGALTQHSRKPKGHKCQHCGEEFTQRRGLDRHVAKTCPALETKTRAAECLAARENSTPGQDQPRELPEANQAEPLALCHRSTAESEERADQAAGLSEPAHRSRIQTRQNSKAQLAKDKHRVALLQKTYRKLKCKYCPFSSVKLATVSRHVTKCRRKTENRELLGAEGEDGSEAAGVEESVTEEQSGSSEEVQQRSRVFSCSRCAFRCNQRRALDSHESRGCLRPDQIQCSLCSFVGKSNTSLTHHMSRVHDKSESKPKRLQCRLCTFTCKQERRLLQHVALKHKGARPHRCRYCPFSTTRRYRLEEHESLHTGLGRHGCGLCRKTFGTASKLRQHTTRIHEKQPSHFCSLCDFSGYTLDDVRRHNLRCHTGALRHACTHCEAHFNSELALRNHCKRVHQLQACFSCPLCEHTCSSQAGLKAHQHTKHRLIRCPACQETFESRESLEIHQRSHLPHQCHLCPFAAKTKPALGRHLLSEHEEGPAEEKPLRCSSCSFSCRHQLVFEQHLRSHGGKRVYRCTDCLYSTHNKQKITRHLRIHTGEKPYSCERCSYTCTEPSRLKLHMRVHQEEKKYLCPECGYKCKWATQLKYHMTKHTGEKRYACDVCEYRTNRADALRVHKDTQHCDARSYICEKCGKAFKTRFILKTHQRQHSEERPYACGRCSKTFRWPAGLRYHYLTHTKQQPFCCRHCSYTAKQKFQVVKHLQRHHPDMPVQQGVVRDSEAGGLTLKEALQGTLEAAAAGEREEEAETVT
ncbi:zinc finger protein 142 [Genypterus blacodes]|uniref:zinc finger protein 142 n=1 Tax=Genypterus blacodes TaxID=154954 RepID=UPI003F757828